MALLDDGGPIGKRLANWPGKTLEDALPLRLAGGLHNLYLTDTDRRLGPVYDGEITDQDAIDQLIIAIARDHADLLLPWFESPPQTNEAGRSASFMAGLKWLSGRVGPRFELNEIGASAGINTMMDRYHYDLGGITAGPVDSPMQITPEWRGPAPPDAACDIVAICGCDKATIDLSQPANALRVKSYIWPENKERMQRVNAAVALAEEQRPDIVEADAADWVEYRLLQPHSSRVTRVIYHSIVWQYLPSECRKRITAAIAAAGAKATSDRPLAWVSLETNRATFRHELVVRYWNGSSQDGEPNLLGQAQAHGAWIEWFDG